MPNTKNSTPVRSYRGSYFPNRPHKSLAIESPTHSTTRLSEPADSKETWTTLTPYNTAKNSRLYPTILNYKFPVTMCPESVYSFVFDLACWWLLSPFGNLDSEIFFHGPSKCTLIRHLPLCER